MKARLPEGYNMKQSDMMRKVQKMQEDVANAQKEVEETQKEEACRDCRFRAYLYAIPILDSIRIQI